MTPQSPPAGDTELIQGILGMGAMAAGDLAAMEDCELAAKALVNAYILAEILKIIGKPRPEDSSIYSSRKLRETNGFDATNELILKLRQAAQARFGAEEATEQGVLNPKGEA